MRCPNGCGARLENWVDLEFRFSAGIRGKGVNQITRPTKAIEVPPTDEQSDWPYVHEARAALGYVSEPAKSDER